MPKGPKPFSEVTEIERTDFSLLKELRYLGNGPIDTFMCGLLSGFKKGERVHIGVCGHQRSDEAILIDMSVGNILINIGGNDVVIAWGDIIELWPIKDDQKINPNVMYGMRGVESLMEALKNANPCVKHGRQFLEVCGTCFNTVRCIRCAHALCGCKD